MRQRDHLIKLAVRALAALVVPVLFGAPPTYNKDVAPILNSQCAQCHRPGEVAPFPLLTYQDAAKRAALIATVTKNRYMPPWKPEPGFGGFQHERRLTAEQIVLLDEWAKAGAPEGDPKDKLPVPTFAEGWQGGEPNLVLQAGTGFTVPADGPDRFQCFVLPLDLGQDSYIQTAEFRPGKRRVVHHGSSMSTKPGPRVGAPPIRPMAAIPASAARAYPPPACSPDGLPAPSSPPATLNFPFRSRRAPTWSCRSITTPPAKLRRISPPSA
jgi:hypothetical protein